MLMLCTESGLMRLGDAVDLGPNASVMLRIATLSAWAELEIASHTQKYLVNIVQPYRKVLASQWIGALRDYASIRAGTELLDDTSAGAVDSSHASLGKEVLLPVGLAHIILCSYLIYSFVVLSGRVVRDTTSGNKCNGSRRSLCARSDGWSRAF